MRKITKLLAFILSMLFVVAVPVGCGSDENIDTTRTQLYVSNFDGGFGSSWLDGLIVRFEDFYKDTEFEEGKKGVQVIVDKAKMTGTSLQDNVKGSRDAVFVTEFVYYYDYLSLGNFMEITDVVTTSLSTYGEDKTIESKMTKQQQDFLKVEGKYYAVPHYAGFNGITYDRELFNTKRLFLGTDGRFNYRSDKPEDLSKLSYGVDNLPGTYDDGLPATYKEFYDLCATMLTRGVTPIIWSGQYQFYFTCMLYALAMQANGYDGALLMNQFAGNTEKYISSIDSDGNPVYDSVMITNDDGYKVYQQAGTYEALRFAEHIIRNGYCDLDSFTKGISHVDTQDKYIFSNRDNTFQPIGMMIEGNWWENEASTTFTSMEGRYDKASKMDRDFGFMPLPKPDTSYLGQNLMVETNSSYMFINSNAAPKQIDLAKKFIAFANTDASLVEFTAVTNTPKALKYDVPQTTLDGMTKFGQSVIKMKNDPNTKLIYQASTSDKFNRNMSVFKPDNMFAYGAYAFVSTAFSDNPSLTAKSYYSGLVESWKNIYNNL